MLIPSWNARAKFAVALIAALIGCGGSARADAIDGDWCFGAQHLNIRGPAIRTPGGTQMSGDYGRHDFRYVVPANEDGAGSEVIMRLNHEEQMTLVRKTGAAMSAPETWRRCRPIS